ncbi:hypothetical protein EI77_04073 [Prosthecobacter fusiformis]|uniref:Uncharacterized protein n=1 Tax=Prosthecobacter fusiformis TaxID=48464 RepID=A0A4R7RM10_9BACT|nr:hypothetical protein EI77_04073 [Prosthecobacter fusiformis]
MWADSDLSQCGTCSSSPARLSVLRSRSSTTCGCTFLAPRASASHRPSDADASFHFPASGTHGAFAASALTVRSNNPATCPGWRIYGRRPYSRASGSITLAAAWPWPDSSWKPSSFSSSPAAPGLWTGAATKAPGRATPYDCTRFPAAHGSMGDTTSTAGSSTGWTKSRCILVSPASLQFRSSLSQQPDSRLPLATAL